MILPCEVVLPSRWVNGQSLDEALSPIDPMRHAPKVFTVAVPPGCKIMADAAVRLLCLTHQLGAAGTDVHLRFDEEESPTMGYLGRLGFFDCLDEIVEVTPGRPSFSAASLYRGTSDRLEEIAALRPDNQERGLPRRLSDKLTTATGRVNANGFGVAAFTVFAELIGNVYEHGKTTLDGYATLQVYPKGNSAKVVVSDNGEGIVATLRPQLPKRLATLTDTDLIVEAFRNGLSRHGSDRGCGLRTCAGHAIRYSAELDIRLPDCRVHLVPSAGGYTPNVALCAEGLPLIRGTHICFDFSLDS